MLATDVAVIGGGIAGASAAYELSARLRVALLEREHLCGYHSTGRSAASFTENYGNSAIRRLARASRAFYQRPEPGFAEVPLANPRGILTIAHLEQIPLLSRALERGREFVPDLVEIEPAEALRRIPILRPDYVAGAFLEPRSLDIDVHATHQAFLRGFKERGGQIMIESEVLALKRRSSGWLVETKDGGLEASFVVNAAGAWADEVAALAGARGVHLVAKRRTAFVVDLPQGIAPSAWPLVDDVGEEFYFKPDAGRLLVSPADATPSPPTDAQPEEVDVAVGVERLERATMLSVARVPRKWAGLRSFVFDGSPVVGWDDEVDGFFWLAAQGGYGIKTAPALARAVTTLVSNNSLPAELSDAGLDKVELSPARCRVGDGTQSGAKQ